MRRFNLDSMTKAHCESPFPFNRSKRLENTLFRSVS